MSKTIDIQLMAEETGITVTHEETTSRLVTVSLSSTGFNATSDGSGRSITVSFGSLPQSMRWDDLLNPPTAENPSPFHEVAFTGDYGDLENAPDGMDLDTLTFTEIDNICI